MSPLWYQMSSSSVVAPIASWVATELVCCAYQNPVPKFAYALWLPMYAFWL